MGSSFSWPLPVPRDYVLRRDVCSYGYFVLWPNHWHVDRQVFSVALDLGGEAAVLELSQARVEGRPPKRGTPLEVRVNRALTAEEQQTARRLLTRLLRLDEDHRVLAAFHAVDPRWKRAGVGRLMRSPTMFEDVVKTVTSCNVTWPNTVTMNRRLCEEFGKAVRLAAGVRHAFPSAEKIARARPANLRGRCRVGYRDVRIVELAKLFARGKMDEAWYADKAVPDATVREALIELPGIGPYAANNILQLLGRYGHIPLDSESVRHGRTVLGMKGTPARVMKQMDRHFAPFGEHKFRSYWFELWDFYQVKRGKSWTWERDTTGASFTAALL